MRKPPPKKHLTGLGFGSILEIVVNMRLALRSKRTGEARSF